MPDLQPRIAAASALFLLALATAPQPLPADAQVFPLGACAGPVGGNPPALEQTCVSVYQGSDPSDQTCANAGACAKVFIDSSGSDGNVLDTTATAGLSADLYWGSKKVVLGDAGVPAGAVMAFDLSTCPTGWTAFTAAANRNVVGVGTSYTLGQTGGEASHTLTVAEMPSHAHNIVFNKHFAADGGNGDFGPGTGNNYSTDATGGGAAHNVLDPYVALLYCKKT